MSSPGTPKIFSLTYNAGTEQLPGEDCGAPARLSHAHLPKPGGECLGEGRAPGREHGADGKKGGEGGGQSHNLGLRAYSYGLFKNFREGLV